MTASAAASRCFKAKAVVLATGGIGRAFRVTSNSWEYTGDGHALAYRAGAVLKDMEFVQFHPTGMVWPPSVAGILVTEGVRGEGGRLKNSEGAVHVRRHPGSVQEPDRRQTPRKAGATCAATGGAASARAAHARPRRPLHRARDQGRAGQPARRRLPRHRLDQGEAAQRRGAHQAQAAQHVPPVQELAGIDITKEAMEVGPTTHYVMGGVRGRRRLADEQRPGPVRGRRVRRGAARRQPAGRQLAVDLLVFGKLAGEHAAAFASDNGAVSIDTAPPWPRPRRWRWSRLERNGQGENPFSIQHDCKDDAGHAGIVRTREEMLEAVERIEAFRAPER
jgi:succinate dehydrogenase / fumarate reductase, flavoprotein subunit